RMVAAAVAARAGQADSARAAIAWARRQVGGDREQGLSLDYDEAAVRMLLGEREVARRLLARYAAGRPALRAFLARDPLFRDLGRI
ncbi:MAG: Protein kinase, partial [Gemmatimonadetes bacterium]|nr:Protein kinase [Gemmatimonadota bacterium]